MSFPPAESRGDMTAVLPHVMISRTTLPWERRAAPRERWQWLALLLFDAAETSDPEAFVDQVITLAEIAEKTPADPGDRALIAPEIVLESWQQPSDRVRVIDVEARTLATIVPPVADLPFLSHVRKSGDREVAAVVANRE